MAIELTPEAFMLQWEKSSANLHTQLWYFSHLIGKYSVEVFKGSFDKGRFNTKGSPKWKEHSKNTVMRQGILLDTETMKNSIKMRTTGKPSAPPRSIVIYTDPGAYGTARSHSGYCYAGVHNGIVTNGGGLRQAPFKAFGHPSLMPIRQFMGHSSYIADKMRELTRVLFFKVPL